MKKRISFLLITGAIFASGILFWTSDSSNAQELVIDKNPSPTIVQKLDELITKLTSLTDLISTAKDDDNGEEPVSVLKIGAGALSVGNQASCGFYSGGYGSWDTSFYRKNNTDWNMINFPPSYPGPGSANLYRNQFVDFNGDGLVDYLFSKKRYYLNQNVTLDGDDIINNGYMQEDTCLLINNGNGWDVAHKCVVGNEGNRVKYYGDCADTSQ